MACSLPGTTAGLASGRARLIAVEDLAKSNAIEIQRIITSTCVSVSVLSAEAFPAGLRERDKPFSAVININLVACQYRKVSDICLIGNAIV